MEGFGVRRAVGAAIAARLTFRGYAAYALAIAEAEPLLFKGTDFGAADVEVVG